MANVMEAKMAEMEKENRVMKAALEDSRTAIDNYRARIKTLEDHSRRLERCVVRMALERYEEEH